MFFQLISIAKGINIYQKKKIGHVEVGEDFLQRSKVIDLSLKGANFYLGK